MNMKRLALLLLATCCTTAMAQQVVLPWMPERDTNHIRTIRKYIYDTTTLERKLFHTVNYDRHGYQTSPLTRLTYNEHGLLTQRASMRKVLPQKGTAEILDTASICEITYSPDGVIQRIKNVGYGYYHDPGADTAIAVYELLTHKSHPVYGLLDYCYDKNIDTNKTGTRLKSLTYDQKLRPTLGVGYKFSF